MPIDQLPDPPGPAEKPPDERAAASASESGSPGTVERAEPPVPPDVRPDWPLIDSFLRFCGFVLDNDARTTRLLKIVTALVASLLVLLGVLIVVAIVAPVDAHVWIKLGSSVAGVAVSSGAFACWRLRKFQKAREAEAAKEVEPKDDTTS